MDKAFKILLDQINSNIKILNENGFRLHDYENPEFYIDKVNYEKEEDRLYFDCKEEQECIE